MDYAATPAVSSSITVLLTLSALPYPWSASTRMGNLLPQQKALVAEKDEFCTQLVPAALMLAPVQLPHLHAAISDMCQFIRPAVK